MVVASPDSLTSIQRLFAFPATGRLVAMESARRRFDGGLAHYVRVRDQLCRTPFCNAPIRHIDHPEPVAGGGDTSAPNGQGLCESCNYTKEDPGWPHRVTSGPMEDHVVEITTPTGHQHRSRAPNLPMPHLPIPERSPLMLRLDTVLAEWTLVA